MTKPPISPLRLFADRTPALDVLCAVVGAEAPPPPPGGSSGAEDWDALLDHCRTATEPAVSEVCRHLEDGARPAVEALATALYLLERLRDTKRDWTRDKTVVLPGSWFTEAAIAPERLGSPTACGQTRAVLDRALDGVDHLLEAAKPLSASRRNLARILCLARCMARRLRRHDPLNRDLHLRPRHRLRCLLVTLIA